MTGCVGTREVVGGGGEGGDEERDVGGGEVSADARVGRFGGLLVRTIQSLPRRRALESLRRAFCASRETRGRIDRASSTRRLTG